MSQSPSRRMVLKRIEEAGKRLGAPTVAFSGRKISTLGEDIYVTHGFLGSIASTSGFYLPLPTNTFGVVIFPDGTSHNMEGGVHEVPPGLYKLQYVDKDERKEVTSPISEMTTDGQKLTLKVIFRYRVVDPILALQIKKPVNTLIKHIESDVGQYICTHDHTDIADSAENHLNRKLLSFFTQRRERWLPLSKAFIITGIKLKYLAVSEKTQKTTTESPIVTTQSYRTLSIFLCHSSSDKPLVRELYKQLKSDQFDPWLDEEKLLPGQDWRQEISKAVRKADVVIICLSRGSINKAGYVQKEIKFALDIADEQPEDRIFLIPLKFEECEVPERVSRWHWVNYFDKSGYKKLLDSLHVRAGVK